MRAKRAVSGAAARSREAANTEAMYILAVCTQAFSASSLQYVSTPYFLVVKWSEWSEVSEVKWIQKGPYIFMKLIYIIAKVYTLLAI